MKRYSQHHIKALLDKFMDGQTTVEEEALLAEYFRSADVPAEWEDYRLMFGYFDRGMEGDLVPVEENQPTLKRLMGRRWWGIAAAACITAAIVATALLHKPTTTTVPETPPIAANDTTPAGETQDFASLQTTSAQLEETQDFASLQSQSTQLEETQDVASLQTTPEQPVETQNLASRAAAKKASHKRANTTRRLLTQNAKLARENERLQRELADLKRRAFIIDLEANGFRAIQDEDGSIVLIDLEQELENELNSQLNNQPTVNIPAL